jgi:hypothetical protein
LHAVSFGGTTGSFSYDPNQPPGGWSKQPSSEVLVLRIPAYSANPKLINSKAVFIDEHGCFPNVPLQKMQENQPLELDIVYFLSGSTLYRRVAGYAPWINVCGRPHLTRTCPQNTADAMCPVDKIVANQVKSWQVELNGAIDLKDSVVIKLELGNASRINSTSTTTEIELYAGGMK